MIRLEDEEDGGLIYEENAQELSEIYIRWCLVGRFLTESSIDFQAMQGDQGRACALRRSNVIVIFSSFIMKWISQG